MRALTLAVLLVLPALAGCAAPSGVNEETYPSYGTAPPPSLDATRFSVFAMEMRDAARARPPIPEEGAYDRFLANATAWARDGLSDEDRARPLNESAPAAAAALAGLDALANATRGSDKEVLATPFVRIALAERWAAAGDEPRALADALVSLARSEVEAANASAHAARDSTTVAGRNALLRAEAVLSLALTQLADAEAALAAPRREADAAQGALEARVSAAGVRFWLAEAAAAPDGPLFAIPDDLAERATPTLARVGVALASSRTDARLALSTSDLAFGLSLVHALDEAGFPEGAWAAAQGLRESLLVYEMTANGTIPSPSDARAAWAEAADNVRTFRDAQRFDRASASVEGERNPFGDATWRSETLRAYAALSLMREISEEREATFPAS